jgi:hypothetical protein
VSPCPSRQRANVHLVARARHYFVVTQPKQRAPAIPIGCRTIFVVGMSRCHGTRYGFFSSPLRRQWPTSGARKELNMRSFSTRNSYRRPTLAHWESPSAIVANCQSLRAFCLILGARGLALFGKRSLYENRISECATRYSPTEPIYLEASPSRAHAGSLTHTPAASSDGYA